MPEKKKMAVNCNKIYLEMKIGDKVRFLNTTGGGVVKAFKDKDIVLVEDEDGFDIPILIRECVVIESGHDAQVRQQPQQQKAINEVLAMHLPTTREKIYIPEETKEGESLSVAIAFLPIDSRNMTTTGFETYLVNDSNYYLSYSYSSRVDNGWICRNAGVIEPNTKVFIEEFERESLNDLENLCMQFIAYKKDKPYGLKNSYSINLKLDTVKFYKLHSFQENDYFEDNALVYVLVKKDIAGRELRVSAEELELAMREKIAQERRLRIQPAKNTTARNEILEIDLHIDELLDDTTGMSSGEILEYQMDKFREVMDAHKSKRGSRIVFIHGKGDGVLKKELLKELKNKYKSANYQDASFREYGYGATMIIIK